jgi:lysyl-tRNA synthetase class 1
MPRASSGKLTGMRILEHLPEQTSVVFADENGLEEAADYSKGEGKLGWRVELAARWKALGVTFEPFGKDHTTSGGSTETADRMAREVFHYPVPGRYQYEWIGLKGRGDMSSSRGIVLLPKDLLKIMPPGAVRRIILGRDPSRRFDIDLEGGFPHFMDEHRGRDKKGLVPFTHLATISQIVGDDVDRAIDILLEGGYREDVRDREALARWLTYARNWAETWAPESFRFRILDLAEAAQAARSLDADQLRYLDEVAGLLEVSLDGDSVQNALYDKALEIGLKPRKAFAAIYTVLLGRRNGPKAGPFIAQVGVWIAQQRFLSQVRDAAHGQGSVR